MGRCWIISKKIIVRFIFVFVFSLNRFLTFWVLRCYFFGFRFFFLNFIEFCMVVLYIGFVGVVVDCFGVNIFRVISKVLECVGFVYYFGKVEV